MSATKPQTRPAVAIRQATRILGTDEAGVAALVKEGRLTETHTRPTSGTPAAIYNVTELEAIASVILGVDLAEAFEAKAPAYEVCRHGAPRQGYVAREATITGTPVYCMCCGRTGARGANESRPMSCPSCSTRLVLDNRGACN